MGKHYTQAGKTYFEFNNGSKVVLSPVSSALVAELQRQHPEPPIPVIEIVNEEGVKFVEETPQDPDYLKKLNKWNADINVRWIDVLLKLGAKPLEVDTIKLEQVKAVMAEVGTPLAGDESFLYLKYCLMSDKEETQQLIDAVQQTSKPEERAIIRALENFSSELQGEKRPTG